MSNLQNSIRFYRDVLGFELVEEESDGHKNMAFLTLGEYGHTIDLVEVGGSESIDAKKSTLQHVAFQVDSYDDLRDAYFELNDRGNTVIGAIDHMTQKSIYVEDPDGNTVEIYHESANALEMFRQGRDDHDPLSNTRGSS